MPRHNEKITVRTLNGMKKSGMRISAVTAYDTPTAGMVDEAGVEIILVGDSLGMVVAGDENTLSVTLDQVIYHSRLVAKARPAAMVLGDMPFGSYQTDVPSGVASAIRLVKEGLVEGVKLEGGRERLPVVSAILEAGIPVMGHIGLMPQTVHRCGGYRLQGKNRPQAQHIIDDALALEQAGVFALLLESVPLELAAYITKKVKIPTIGIGAGPHCDGQILVFHDMMGMTGAYLPKHVRQYADLQKIVHEAMTRYIDEIRRAQFPGERESQSLGPEFDSWFDHEDHK